MIDSLNARSTPKLHIKRNAKVFMMC